MIEVVRASHVTSSRWKKKRLKKQRSGMYLFHDTGLSFRESDVSSRFVLDKLNLNLSSLATGLVILVIVIFILIRSGSLHASTSVDTGRIGVGVRHAAITSRKTGGIRASGVVVCAGGGLRVVV
jgi:hypothetical protein